MSLFKTKEAKNAVLIGTMCSVAYMFTYFGRNMLSAVSPQLIEEGVFSTAFIGKMSSMFFICYAVGQLLNGMIGDKIRANYMISFGLILAGICSFSFSKFTECPQLICILYGSMGFFLSMIFAPMVKITAENTNEVHATRCCLGYEFGSLLGAPFVGAVAVILAWKNVLQFGSVALILMGVVCLIGFAGMERRGIVKYNQYQRTKEKGSIKVLIEHGIIKFTLIAILTGVIRTTVVFWIPTYLAQYLGFTSEMSAGIYTVVTLLISMSAFLSVFIYERLGNNMELTILIGFTVSTVAFLGTYLVHQKWVNIVFLAIAIVFEQCASAMIWDRYCPSLRDTGMVSSATGFLDFSSYMAASVASSLFANAVEQIGWGSLILVWAGLMGVGIVVVCARNFKLQI